jgi:predicted transcriptional regulator
MAIRTVSLCYTGQDPFWLDRSTLNRVLRIKQLIVQELGKRENYIAGSLTEILLGLAQRYRELRRAFYGSRDSNTRPWLLG